MYTCIKILQSVLAIKHSDEQDIHHFQNIRNQSRSLKKRLVHHKEKLSNIQSESKLINGVAGKTTGHVILIWKRWHMRRSWIL